ncbi:MAG: hypothetical protein J5857_08695 [Treponema sp.]|nr:hypothetical protein [Treponema sp.]
MAGMKDKVFTMVVPRISRKEAETLKSNLISIKKRTAPKAVGNIVIGKKENFGRLMVSCIKRLRG